MTSTTSQTAQSGSAGQLTTSATLSPQTLCLQLGWSMQRLYRAHPEAEAPLGPLPDRLPGLSRLTRLRRVEIDLARAQTCLAEIAEAASWKEDKVPDLARISTHLDVFQEPSGRTRKVANSGNPVEDYREAVLRSHLSLISMIAAAGAPLGKAYNLGRALADTCRPSQSHRDLQDSFEPHRLGQLRQDLADLASVLPPHSAKAVAQSLTWWRDAVYMADDSNIGLARRQMLGNVRTDAPELRRPRGILNPKISTASSSGDMNPLREALSRQGELWRVVLTGEKKPLDLLTPDDYLEAARRAVAGGRVLAARVFVAAPKTTLTIFLLVSGVLTLVLAVIHYSHATSGGKLAAFLIAVGGYLGALARAAMPRLKSAAGAVEQPLWQSALDYLSAEGISIPPVGRPDAAGWAQLSGASAAAADTPGAAPEIPGAAAEIPGARRPSDGGGPDTESGASGALGSQAGEVTSAPVAHPVPPATGSQ
jgi:hypothetical protein